MRKYFKFNSGFTQLNNLFHKLKSKKFYLTGFTLVELLMVIAVIGLLSSIILVALKSGKDSASVVRNIRFSSSIKNSIGDELKGEWAFEQNPNDSSGNSNNCTLIGSPTYSNTSNASSNLRYYIIFPSSPSSYLDCGNGSSIDIIGKLIAIEAWIKTSSGSTGGIVAKNNALLTNIQYGLVWAGSQAVLYLNGAAQGGSGNITLGSWTHIAVTYDGNLTSNNIVYYVNGVRTNTAAYTTSISTVASSNLTIGSTKTANYFVGYADNVRIYARALSGSEIQQHYAEGAAEYGLAIKE